MYVLFFFICFKNRKKICNEDRRIKKWGMVELSATSEIIYPTFEN